MAQFVGVGGSIKQEPGLAAPYPSSGMTLKPDAIASYQTAASLANGLVVPTASVNGLATLTSPCILTTTSAQTTAPNGLAGSRGNSPQRQDQHQQQSDQCNVNGQASPQGSNASEGSGQATDPPPNKLFVGGLSWQTTTEKLRDYFSAYGTVTDVLIMKDPITQVSWQPCWQLLYSNTRPPDANSQPRQREKRPREFRGQTIRQWNFHPRWEGGSAHSIPSYKDGSSTNLLFGRKIDADAFILRIRVWWSGIATHRSQMQIVTMK